MKILRILLGLTFILFLSHPTFCQLISSEQNSEQVYFGPKLGFSFHKASFNFKEDEEIFDQKFQVGYQIGAAFEKPLKNIFSFYSELYFTQKGKKTIIVENGLINQSKYYFLEAPVLLRLNFEGGSAEAGNFMYHVDIGPTIGYWLGGKGTVGLAGFKKYKVAFDKDTSRVNLSKELLINGANRLQWGLNLGLGIEYPVIKDQNVYIDLRFVFGHSNLAEVDGDSEFDIFGYDDDLNVRFHQIVLTASYMFTYDWRLGFKGRSTINKRKLK